jgi:lipooligosaccharide transport system permease protein
MSIARPLIGAWPAGPLGRSSRLVERNLMVYRRTWMILVSGFFEPLLYLLGVGFGIGSLVGSVATEGGRVVPYAVFVAPALMASSAMNGAIYDSTFNFFFKLKYAKIYDGVLATPVAPADVARGEIAWALIRGTLYAIAFLVVMVALGLVASPWAVLAVPASILLGFSFAAMGCAATTFMRSWQDFDLVQLVLLPLFLFSATFFPITVYPAAMRLVVELSPLYHGIHLIRGLTTGAVGWGLLVDMAFVAGLGLAAMAITSRRLRGLILM